MKIMMKIILKTLDKYEDDIMVEKLLGSNMSINQNYIFIHDLVNPRYFVTINNDSEFNDLKEVLFVIESKLSSSPLISIYTDNIKYIKDIKEHFKE